MTYRVYSREEYAKTWREYVCIAAGGTTSEPWAIREAARQLASPFTAEAVVVEDGVIPNGASFPFVWRAKRVKRRVGG